MIRHLKKDEIVVRKWDECIKESVNGMVYANSWYLDIVAENWEALVEDDYVRVFPLIPGTKYGIHYLYQPAFTQQLGIFSRNILSEEIVGEFIQAIPQKYKFAEINLNTLNRVPKGKYKIEQWKNYELDLIKSYDRIRKNYSDNLNRNLKKSEKAGLSILKNVKPDEIIRIFRENKGKKIRRYSDEDYLRFQRLIYSGIYKGKIETYGVFSPHNELCAGIVFLRSDKKMIFLFSGLSETGKELGAMPFLIDHFISENARHHITLDFEGSNDPGLARFYQGFGSKECTYPHLIINNLPFVTRSMVKLVKGLRKLTRIK
ncbi:MAG: hypothetical protein JW731_12985 [Bacteroidales bacterium]|nr:hypothetical protein [Bacteroidales bacterium]